VAIAILVPIWHVRYLLTLLPFFLGGLAALAAGVRSAPARGVVIAALSLLSIPGVVEEKRVAGRTPWRETARYLSETPGHVCLVGPKYLARPLAWYYRRPFEVVTGVEALAGAERRARGDTLHVVYCDIHDPRDPLRLGVRRLEQALGSPHVEDFGVLHVYSFRRPDAHGR
jgi:hypothetical protein